MISIDMNSLNDLAEVERAIEKLSFIRGAIKARERRRADVQGYEELLRRVHSGEATWGLKKRLGLLPDTFNGMDPQSAIQDDGIVCLIDGEKRKFLSRYVRAVHDMDWQDYLARFDLPADYPRTSRDVIAQRSKAATERGFGKHDRTPEAGEQIHVMAPVIRRSFGRRPAPPQVSVNIDIGGATVSAQTDRAAALDLGRKLRGVL